MYPPQHPLDTLPYRGTSLIRNSLPLGPYSRPHGGPMERLFLMSEVTLYRRYRSHPSIRSHTARRVILGAYRVTSLIRNTHPP